MIRKIYQKPKCRGIYIDAKSTILAESVGQVEDNDPLESKRHNFLWEDEDEY